MRSRNTENSTTKLDHKMANYQGQRLILWNDSFIIYQILVLNILIYYAIIYVDIIENLGGTKL